MLSNKRTALVVFILTFIVVLTIISSAYISYNDVFVIGKLYGFRAHSDQNVIDGKRIRWDTYKELVRPIDIVNSTTLFNSIYAALKQAGSDIHPIGLSYFPAMIPKGTLMYHSGKAGIPEGLEWLAMDHEFSYNFAMHGQKYGRNASNFRFHGLPGSGKKIPDGTAGGPPKGFSFDRSHFLTFRATRDLNKLFYLDGASAAKTETGEMDTQKLLSDVIEYKMNNTNTDDANNKVDNGARNVMKERLYAERICDWGKPFGLDGYVRVELGFEVVLCDFLNGSTELVSNVSLPAISDILGLPRPTNVTKENGWPLNDDGKIIEDQLTNEQKEIMDQEDYWQSILDEYTSMQGFEQIRAGNVHDSGDFRIKLDYRHLVTGVNRTIGDINPNNRRLLNDKFTFEQQIQLVDDLESSLQSGGFDPYKSNNWQKIIKEIVDKFSPMIKVMDNILNSDDELSLGQIALKTTRYTINFVNRFTGKENTVKMDDEQGEFGFGRQFAVYQYTRPEIDLATDSDFLIWSAIVNVVTEVVDTIYDINDLLMPIVTYDLGLQDISQTEIDAQESARRASERIARLISVLKWITLDYKCDRKCEWDEVCYTPSWGPSPLSWVKPEDNNATAFGMHFDDDIGRLVVNKELQCISADFLIEYNRGF
ncbi:hypothetical protein C6P45_002366 [Maudiozyma exigua]|uniref:Uncharacterized protein n=1 Tax=Maudiozyma exigua TaxID=34358 RepID=A0A9P6WCQ3_MAUEX|nr:hypothetical protein C6P45_002366 [Kazachstania exigua]